MATVKSEFNLPDGNGGFNKHHLETELAQIEDIVRQPSTQYAADVIKFVAGLPTGWYLECTTGGETASTDITLPASPAIGDTVTDGTVVWTIRKVADTTTNTYSLPTASASAKGGIKVGSGLSMNGDTLNNAYSLPTASSSTLGGVKTGSNITNSSGTISLTKANVTSALGYTPPTTNTTYSTGTASTSGITKLYTGIGDNTDGTMTQKAIKGIVGTGGGIVAQNLATNGYVKFANGFTIQWGGSTGNVTTVSFPIVFTTVYSVVGAPGIIGSIYNSGFSLSTSNYNTTYWIAVGKI